MTDPHENLVEAALNTWCQTYAIRGSLEDTMRAVIALIAERTKEATPEMLSHRLYGMPLEDQWKTMHRASALWPKEKAE